MSLLIHCTKNGIWGSYSNTKCSMDIVSEHTL